MDGEALVRGYFAMWNSGDTGRVHQILAPDWVDHGHPEITGPDGVAASVAAIRAARPGLAFRVDAVLTGDGRAAVLGAAGSTGLVWLFTVRDGQLAELRTFRDAAT